MAHASKHATPGDPFEASMGVYIFKRDVLMSLLQENEDHFGSDAGPDTHFGHDVIPHALREGYRVVAHHFDGYWRVGSLSSQVASRFFGSDTSETFCALLVVK